MGGELFVVTDGLSVVVSEVAEILALKVASGQ